MLYLSSVNIINKAFDNISGVQSANNDASVGFVSF